MKSVSVKQALALLGAEIQDCDYAARGFHLNVIVAPEQVVAAAETLDREGFFLEAITGVDWLGELEALAKEAAKAAAAKAAATKKAAEAAAKKAEAEGSPPPSEAPAGESAALPEEEVGPAAAAPPPAPPTEDSFEVVYDFNHFAELCRVVVRTRMPRSKPQLPTISEVYPGANWHERETHDFFGIVFENHPDLSPLLLPEDADYHPLRKDYKP